MKKKEVTGAQITPTPFQSAGRKVDPNDATIMKGSTLDPQALQYGPTSPMAPEIEGSAVTSTRVWMHRQSRFNPLRYIRPEKLVQDIEQFDRGTLAWFARDMEAIAETDDAIKANILKRKTAVIGMGYQIVIDPDIEDEDKETAEEHAKALRFFYKHARATHAIDRSVNMGFTQLVHQMLDALSFKYSMHELLWNVKETPNYRGLTCTFNYVPLYMFENRSGEMRYIPSDGAYEGIVLAQNEWMITTGDWLMRSAAVAFMYKQLALKGWAIYNDKFGIPSVVCKTPAKFGSEQFRALEDAVRAIGQDFGAIIGEKDELMPVVFGGAGTIPHPMMVERMDRFISILYRGGDLSTLSNGNANGSNPQQEDSRSLEKYDAQIITETLNQQIDRLVIKYMFGEDAEPLAFIKISVPDQKDINREIAVDNHMLRNGLSLHAGDMYDRYSRKRPDQNEDESEIVKGQNTQDQQQQQDQVDDQGGSPDAGDNDNNDDSGDDETKTANARRNRRGLANDRGLNRGESSHVKLLRTAVAQAADAESAALAPLWDRVDGIMELAAGDDPKALELAIKKFLADIPQIQKDISKDQRGARALEAIDWAALLNGLAEAHVARN